MKEENIISYNPDLNIYGKKSSYVLGNDVINTSLPNIKTETKINTNKSKTLINFIYYSPSSFINPIDELITILDKKLKDMENQTYSNSYLSSYFTTNDDSEKNKILKDNMCDFEYGSNILESYALLNSINNDLKSILKTYISCIFGENIDVSETYNIVKDYIAQIEKYEEKEEFNKVNYMSLYYDTKVAYILSDFIGQLDNTVSLLESEDNLSITSSNVNNIMNDFFTKENNIMEININDINKIRNNISTAIKNIYIKKQNIEDNLDLFSDIYNFDNGKEILYDIKSKCFEDLNSSVSDLMKICMNYNIIYGDLSQNLKNKSKYRNFQ